MARASGKSPKPGDSVVLTELPPGLVRGLPRSAQKAIAAIVGKPVLLLEFDENGDAELEFVAGRGHIHSIHVNPKYIVPAE